MDGGATPGGGGSGAVVGASSVGESVVVGGSAGGAASVIVGDKAGVVSSTWSLAPNIGSTSRTSSSVSTRERRQARWVLLSGASIRGGGGEGATMLGTADIVE
jgi:hypothetical protein